MPQLMSNNSMNEYKFSITNLACSACSKVCAMILQRIDGVVSVDIREDGQTIVTSTKPLDMELIKMKLQEKEYHIVFTS